MRGRGREIICKSWPLCAVYVRDFSPDMERGNTEKVDLWWVVPGACLFQGRSDSARAFSPLQVGACCHHR
jgi:hypothetical protein